MLQALGAGGALAEPLTPAEEALLLKFYEAKVQAVCRELRLPLKVLGAAVTYIKRFYVARSALDVDPQAAALTCLYLACKAEECYLSAAELGRLSGMPAEVLLRHEIQVLQGLGFDLLVHAPHRAVDGCLAEVEACRAEAGDADCDGLAALVPEQMQRARAAAYGAADALMLTDAPLLYTPGQLGLAAARSGFAKAGVKLRAFVGRTVRKALPASAAAAAVEEAERRLLAALGAIDALGASGAEPVQQQDVVAIDRKLKACRSPLLEASSEAARQAAEAKAKAKADKAARKAAKSAEERASREADLGILGDAAGGGDAAGEQQRKRPRQEGGEG